MQVLIVIGIGMTVVVITGGIDIKCWFFCSYGLYDALLI